MSGPTAAAATAAAAVHAAVAARAAELLARDAGRPVTCDNTCFKVTPEPFFSLPFASRCPRLNSRLSCAPLRRGALPRVAPCARPPDRAKPPPSFPPKNRAPQANDGVCDDGRHYPNMTQGLETWVVCDLGTDCADCGPWKGATHTASWCGARAAGERARRRGQVAAGLVPPLPFRNRLPPCQGGPAPATPSPAHTPNPQPPSSPPQPPSSPPPTPDPIPPNPTPHPSPHAPPNHTQPAPPPTHPPTPPHTPPPTHPPTPHTPHQDGARRPNRVPPPPRHRGAVPAHSLPPQVRLCLHQPRP
jgi:hypothetical protein